MQRIDILFDRMDTWRHFPKYQLERRADLFFALYLVEVLEARLGYPLQPELIPEFPVRLGTIYPEKSANNSSCNIDYVALSAAADRCVFVELKTETSSRREQQDDYLLAAQAAGLPRLLAGVLQIFRATKARRKYYHLLAQLEQMSLLHIPGEMHEIMGRSRLQGVTSASERVTIKAAPVTPQILYVQPNGMGSDIINFHEFAGVVRRYDDPLSTRFARSLVEWAEVEAGHGRAAT